MLSIVVGTGAVNHQERSQLLGSPCLTDEKELACDGRRLRRRERLALQWISPVVLVVKNLPANAGDVREEGSVPGLG